MTSMFLQSIKVWSKVDNVDIDAKTGDLWIGTHPNMYAILKHLGDPTTISPSQVKSGILNSQYGPANRAYYYAYIVAICTLLVVFIEL